MNILLSNDDGYEAEGIIALANELCKSHKVLVVAPSGNRSGISHALSVLKPMKLKKHVGGYDERVTVYALDGTPADCVKFGLYNFKDVEIDLVMAGINDGPNLAIDTMYSGTVGAAMEGANHFLPAIAVSLAEHFTCRHFDTAAKVAAKLIEKLVKISRNCVWNVNVPDIEYDEIKGIKATKVGHLHYDDFYGLVEGSRDEYFLGGEPIKESKYDVDTDVGAVNSGYVSVTPLKIDRTDYGVLSDMDTL